MVDRICVDDAKIALENLKKFDLHRAKKAFSKLIRGQNVTQNGYYLYYNALYDEIDGLVYCGNTFFFNPEIIFVLFMSNPNHEADFTDEELLYQDYLVDSDNIFLLSSSILLDKKIQAILDDNSLELYEQIYKICNILKEEEEIDDYLDQLFENQVEIILNDFDDKKEEAIYQLEQFIKKNSTAEN